MSEPSQFLLYTAPDGAVKVDVFIKDETVWLTQKALAELFGVKVPGVNKHLKNIFDSGELTEAAVVSILETTAADGKNYQTRYYNLDAIIAVGYRVNSFQATQFRIWRRSSRRRVNTRSTASGRMQSISRTLTGRSNGSRARSSCHDQAIIGQRDREWEMNGQKWETLRREFEKRPVR